MHELVAAYLGYKAPADEPEDDGPDDATANSSDANRAAPPVWMQQGMRSIPGPEAARNATREEALAAFERHFFGEIKDVQQL